MNERKAVCIERCMSSLVGGRWNRAVHVPRQRLTQLDNHRRRKGWLAPSLESRVCNVVTWVQGLRRVCPVTAISMELVRFNTQAMERPEITGVEHQQGTLAGFELREYLLEKWARTCAYCGKQNSPLQIEHIQPRANGGTDRASNLTLACATCTISKGAQDIRVFLAKKPEILKRILATAKPPLRDAAAVNSTRWALYERLQVIGLPIECGSGGRTKFNRSARNLPKTHWLDAACLGASTPETIQTRGITPLLILANGHGRRQMCLMGKRGFPRTGPKQFKRVKGFQTGDIVRALVSSGTKAGTYVGRLAVRTSG